MADPDSTVINTSINQKDPKEALVIAVTTRTIFNLEREHEIFLTKGKEEYVKHQQANENSPLEQGTAFPLIQEIQAPRAQLRIVFDGDAVLFSDETDRVFHEKGLEEAVEYEKIMETVPMGEGPLKAFALHLGKMRKKFGQEDSPIRIYLVTARSGCDMGIRIIKTLREWGLSTDEAFFMAGAPKGPILSKIQPHIFFDDNFHNIKGAQDVGIPSALVPYGCQTGT
ncbi:hypothetical protein Chor_016368 [Crotalus horridus]